MSIQPADSANATARDLVLPPFIVQLRSDVGRGTSDIPGLPSAYFSGGSKVSFNRA